MDQAKLDQQSQHWEENFSNKPEMFGLEPSYSAKKALEIFKEKKINNIVDLGAGLGRDSVFFAKNSINVLAIDNSFNAIKIINKKIQKLNLSKFVTTKVIDIRNKLPFEDCSIDAFYSHMLYCMALTNSEIVNLNREIHRVLKPDGINFYTVRNTSDGDYKKGIHRGENLYENDGFIVHFFSEEKINQLLNGFKNIQIEIFEEGSFPRKLFCVYNKKI